MTVAEEKRRLRRDLRRERKQIDESQRRMWDDHLHQQIWQDDAYQRSCTVMLYLSMPEEIQTWPLLHRAWSDRKRVCVPKVIDRREGMIAVEITDLSDLAPGTMGIMEPLRSDAVDPKELDYVLVPGLAFDTEGYRLGYGGGFYDRFLATVTGVTVGLVYPPFNRPVPKDTWDVPVQKVLVPRPEQPEKRI